MISARDSALLFAAASRSDLSDPFSETLQQPLQIVALQLWSVCFAGSLAQLTQQLFGATVHIVALQHPTVTARITVRTGAAPQRVTLLARLSAIGKALFAARLLLTTLCLLGQCLAQAAHSLTQGFKRLALLINCLTQCPITQGAFRAIHGFISPTQCFTSALSGLRTLTGQVLPLTVQLVPQGPLPLGQPFFERLLPPLTGLIALSLLLTLLLSGLPLLTRLLPALLTRLPLALLLSGLLPLLLLALLTLLALLIFVQLPERFVRQLLLVAQGFGQALHRLLAGGLALALPLSHLHVFQHFL